MTEYERVILDMVKFGVRREFPSHLLRDIVSESWLQHEADTIVLEMRARMLGTTGEQTESFPDGPFQRWKLGARWRRKLFGPVRWKKVTFKWWKVCPHMARDGLHDHLAYLKEVPGYVLHEDSRT